MNSILFVVSLFFICIMFKNPIQKHVFLNEGIMVLNNNALTRTPVACTQVNLLKFSPNLFSSLSRQHHHALGGSHFSVRHGYHGDMKPA